MGQRSRSPGTARPGSSGHSAAARPAEAGRAAGEARRVSGANLVGCRADARVDSRRQGAGGVDGSGLGDADGRGLGDAEGRGLGWSGGRVAMAPPRAGYVSGIGSP